MLAQPKPLPLRSCPTRVSLPLVSGLVRAVLIGAADAPAPTLRRYRGLPVPFGFPRERFARLIGSLPPPTFFAADPAIAPWEPQELRQGVCCCVWIQRG